MKKLNIVLFLIMFMCMGIMPASTYIHAETKDSVTKVIEVDLDDESSASTASTTLNTVVTDVASYSEKKLYLYPTTLRGYSAKDKKEIVNKMVLLIRNSKLSSPEKNRITSGVTELDSGTSAAARLLEDDVSGELREATSKYNVLSKYINPVLGFMMYVLVIGFTVTIFCDISYISVPFVRGLIDLTAKEESGRPRFLITNEAYRTVIDTEASDSKSIVLICYVKKMAVPMFVLAIVIAYMLRGQIFSFVGFILDLVSGIFED